MKHVFKLIGIIALVAVIGFGMMSCPEPDDGGGSSGGEEPGGAGGTATITMTGVQMYALVAGSQSIVGYGLTTTGIDENGYYDATVSNLPQGIIVGQEGEPTKGKVNIINNSGMLVLSGIANEADSRSVTVSFAGATSAPFTLTVQPAGTKFVIVTNYQQNPNFDPLVEGEEKEVKYRTITIGFEPGTYTPTTEPAATVANLPNGVTFEGITVSENGLNGELKLQTDATATAGTTDNLILTIGTETSEMFSLVISSPPTVSHINVSGPTSVGRGTTGHVYFAQVFGSINPFPYQTVTWSVEDAEHAETKFEGNVLTVHEEESATAIIVRATSIYDTGVKSGSYPVTVTAPPTASKVNVSGNDEVAKGKSATYSAVVEGNFQPHEYQGVTWSIDETGKDENTYISGDGVLHVARGEALNELTVRATSTLTPGVSGGKTVTLKEPSPVYIQVGQASGNLTAGQAGSVTYTVTTTGIDPATYSATLNNPPAGVFVSGNVQITGSSASGSGTLTLNGTINTVANTHNLTLTIDGEESELFTLVIEAPKAIASVAQQGTLYRGVPGSVTFEVTTTGFQEGSREAVVTLSNGNSLPDGITASDYVYIDIEGKATLELKAINNTITSNQSLRLTIDGVFLNFSLATISCDNNSYHNNAFNSQSNTNRWIRRIANDPDIMNNITSLTEIAGYRICAGGCGLRQEGNMTFGQFMADLDPNDEETPYNIKMNLSEKTVAIDPNHGRFVNIDMSGSTFTVATAGGYGQNTLVSIILPEDLEDMGNQAFYMHTNLTSIRIPDKVKAIKQADFSTCTALTSVYIGKGVETFYTTTIANSNVFFACNSLAEITVDPDNKYFSSEAGVLYDIDKTELIVYPRAKQGGVNLPPTLKTIGTRAFELARITEITLPENLVSIGEYAFIQCTRLTSIIIPDNITTIPISTFERCTSLASISIPAITFVGNLAFSNTAIVSITFREQIPSASYPFGSAFFQNTNLKDVFYAAEGDAANGRLGTYVRDDIATSTTWRFAHTCQWSAWAVETPPTCTIGGVEIRHCTHDEFHIHSETRAGANPLGHEWINNWNVHCIEEERVCNRGACEHIQTRTGSGHLFNEGSWIQTTAPTYWAYGVESNTCARGECGEIVTRQGAAPKPLQYRITGEILMGNTTGFTAKLIDTGDQVGTASQTLPSVLNSIRTHANKMPCEVTIGDGTALDIRNIANTVIIFDGSQWGEVTLRGGLGTWPAGMFLEIHLSNGATVNSYADISAPVNYWSDNALFRILDIGNGTTLNIKGGTVRADSSSPRTILNDSYTGTVNIEGGEVILQTTRADSNAIYNRGKLNISGGTVTATYTGNNVSSSIDHIRAIQNWQSQAVINISGGTVSAISTGSNTGNGAIYATGVNNRGTITINDGTIFATTSNQANTRSVINESGTVTIYQPPTKLFVGGTGATYESANASNKDRTGTTTGTIDWKP